MSHLVCRRVLPHMASQSIPQSYEPLVRLFEEAANGARQHGAAVGLKHNTEAEIWAELEAIIGRPPGSGDHPPELPGLKTAWNAARAAKVVSSDQLRVAKEKGRALALACSNALRPRLGNRWSSKWVPVGFTGGSLEIPDNPLSLLHDLRGYFSANPTHEVPNLAPDIHITATACHAAAQAIGAATLAVNQSTVAANEAKELLDVGVRQARKRLSGLRDELSLLLGRDDKRWYHFGFDRPSDPQVPETPEGVRGVSGLAGNGSVFLEWQPARRAENYRVLVCDAAGQEILERLTSETDLTLNGLASGSTIKVLVSARNGRGGESIAAPVVMIAVL